VVRGCVWIAECFQLRAGTPAFDEEVHTIRMVSELPWAIWLLFIFSFFGGGAFGVIGPS
jgi:hypothetical protein